MKKIANIINEEILKLTEVTEEKYYQWTDKSGRGEKPLKLAKSNIAKSWDLGEEDWFGKTLGEFLEESYIGDVWETQTEKLECIGIY
jgi:hypothetical protein